MADPRRLTPQEAALRATELAARQDGRYADLDNVISLEAHRPSAAEPEKDEVNYSRPRLFDPSGARRKLQEALRGR